MLKKIFFFITYIWPEALGGCKLRKIVYRKTLKKLGKNVIFADLIKITNHKNISIGSKTSFLQGSFLHAHNRGRIEIGNNCSFNTNVILGASEDGKIKIGSNCLVGPNVVFRAADHNFSDKKKPINSQGHKKGTITVGNNVWIGANCVVTRNTNIGNGCVVGAGSVVTRDLPAFTVCCGVPAKPIRAR